MTFIALPLDDQAQAVVPEDWGPSLIVNRPEKQEFETALYPYMKELGLTTGYFIVKDVFQSHIIVQSIQMGYTRGPICGLDVDPKLAARIAAALQKVVDDHLIYMKERDKVNEGECLSHELERKFQKMADEEGLKEGFPRGFFEVGVRYTEDLFLQEDGTWYLG